MDQLWRPWPVLALFAPVYWAVSHLHRLYMGAAFGWTRTGADFQRNPPTIPLVLIGALKAGGSGKTSVTLALAHLFLDRGLNVAILAYRIGKGGLDTSRIGEEQRILSEVQPGDDWRRSSDEALLLREQSGCRVFVTRHRALAWKKLHSPLVYGERPFDVILSDDGLEDPRLKGAMRILLMAPRERPGVFDLLPAGPYRQTWSTSGRADLILEGPYAEGAEEVEVAQAGTIPVAVTPSGRLPVHPFWRKILLPSGMDLSRPWIALCALGDNESFLRDLRRKGLVPVAVLDGVNHTLIAKHRMESALQKYPNAGLLCTRKDFIKLEGQFDNRYSLQVVDQNIHLDIRVQVAVEAYLKENSR